MSLAGRAWLPLIFLGGCTALIGEPSSSPELGSSANPADPTHPATRPPGVPPAGPNTPPGPPPPIGPPPVPPVDACRGVTPDPGRVAIHRLNRAEYETSVRQLFEMDLAVAP